jgi:hypothetical protein
MRKIVLIPILLTTLFSCAQEKKVKPGYPAHVGDINSDPKLDDPNFKPCDEEAIKQYYNFGKGLQYKGEKPKINEHFKVRLKTSDKKNESGFLTIRFIVNCAGKTGRFRTQGMDENYNRKTFDDNLTDQLVTLTKIMDGWVIGEHDGKTYDYYQYLTFKIEDGRLIEIMP